MEKNVWVKRMVLGLMGLNMCYIPSGKLKWQWNMDLLKMYSLLKMGIFHCHVSLLECIRL